MSELEYDTNFATWLTAAGITPASTPINIRGVIHQILQNLNGVGVGSMLGRTQYAPSTAHTYSPVAAATGLTALDSTNLAVTFKVPASGSVLVRLTGWVTGPAAAATSTIFGVTSTTASPGTVVGVTALAGVSPTATAADNGDLSVATILVTGLTATASLTWYFAASFSGTQSSIVAQGATAATTVPTGAPAVIEVWAA